jgi:LysR family glycine cleavage system transcriptional activator
MPIQLNRLPLSTLPAFREAARTQNLRGAAELLHLTHGAVSQQIRHLEEQLGFQLFDRQGRSLRLNAAGAALQRAVNEALDLLGEGARAAQQASEGKAEVLRVTMLPSFAQRWLLPRMNRWRARHPELTLDIHTSQNTVDLKREGFHAALRMGQGSWRGLRAERLLESPLIAVAAPSRAARLRYGDHAALAAEPLLGANDLWVAFLSQCGCRLQGKTVAEFNDAGLMLQAAEQDLGIALARELLAADALRAGRLVRVSPHSLADEETGSRLVWGYWLAYPEEHASWPALAALRQWLLDEIALSREQLAALPAAAPGVQLAGGATAAS